MARRSRPRPDGFTLIEVMVVLAVIGILAALTLSAVQAARESARRGQCVNHLRQIGIALQSYHARNNVFPPISLRSGLAPSGAPYANHGHSPLVRMLSEFDQPGLFNAVNFDFEPNLNVALACNATVLTTSLGMFLCPSDASTPVSGYGRVGYRFSIGPHPAPAAPRSMRNAPFCAFRCNDASDFQDGLSNTVGVSERLQGDWTRGPFRVGGDYPAIDPLDTLADSEDVIARAVARCSALDSAQVLTVESRGGESWFFSSVHFTLFTTCTRPNEPGDCAFTPQTDILHGRAVYPGIMTASSAHRGGVNVGMMDGSVRFVADGISPDTWWALGTRSGGEVVGLD